MSLFSPPAVDERPEAQAERTMLLFRIGQTGVLIHSTLIGAALYMFWDHIETPILVGWAAVMWGITAWRATYCRRVTRRAPPPDALPRYQVLYDRMILMTGVWWGVGTTLLFVPGHPALQAFLALLVGGTAAGAVGTLSGRLGTVHRALLPSLIPLSANFLLRSETKETFAIGLLMLLFLAALSVVARNFNTSIAESLRLRYELADKSRALEADIAHRERVEADLREASRVAKAAVAAKSRFLARASHDLRQPLHALGLLVASLDRRLKVPEDREILWRIDQSVEAMSLLFNALLDISRLDAGAVHPEVRSFRLDDLLAPMIDEFRLLAEVKGLTLRHVPSQAVVRGDPGLLSAILRNLISNAIRYTPRGKVLVGCRRVGADAVRMEVHDTGIGIPEDQQAQVFEEFVQITRGDNEKYGRFGLGLSIVRRLAEVLDHPLALRSQEGRGSCFSVVLPRAQASVGGLNLQTAGGVRRVSLDGLRVLVVDDEEDIREATASLLGDWGAVVTTAEDGQGALDAIRREGPPDTVLLDLDLPDMDGRAVIAALRADHGSGPAIILMTGDILAQPRKDDPPLLHKPVPAARLRTLLNRSARRRATS